MKIIKISTLLTAILVTNSVFAIDRNANMIDAVRLDYNTYENSEYFGIHITGENVVKDTDGKWAILAGITGGRLSLDAGPEFDAIGIEIGTKYYLESLTSIALLASYTWSNGDTVDYETPAVTARIKQRLAPAYKPVSPYLKGEITGQFVDAIEDYDVIVFRAMLGCDFMMSDDFAMVFEGGISESENLDDGNDPEDGWLLTLAMQYYWE